MRVSKNVAKHLCAGVLAAAVFSSAAVAEPVLVTVAGTYEFTGAAPSPTANFTLSFTVERSPLVCGGSPGVFIACGASPPRYTNGPLDVILGTPTVLFKDAANKGGLSLFQDDVSLNRLGFVIGSSVLFSGTLANPTLVDGVYAITPAHCGGDPQLQGDLCSYAGQGFASGDVANNPFFDPVTLQSDDPILSGTITIGSAAATAAPEPATLALLGLGLAGLGLARRRRAG
jgi:hypothetical protein